MSKRNGSKIKQLSVAIGMARKQNYSFFWPRSRRRMAVCSCQAAFTNLFSHSTILWLKCSWIFITIHCRITEKYGGSTVENSYHTGVQFVPDIYGCVPAGEWLFLIILRYCLIVLVAIKITGFKFYWVSRYYSFLRICALALSAFLFTFFLSLLS